MKRLALIAALSASPVFAENIDVFVVDEGGDGVVQRESNVTLQDAGVLIDSPPPPGTSGVVLNNKTGTVTWTSETPEEVNKRYGGDGEPYVEDLRDTEDEEEMKFDPEEEEEERRRRDAEEEENSDIDFDEVEDFFPDPDSMQSARIQPRDGFWAIEIREQTFSGCPAQIESMARSQMAAMNMAGGRGTYGPNYTPQTMAPQLDWTQVGTNSWLGSLDMMSDTSGVFLQWGVQVISPTVINNRQQLNFAVGGLGNCEVFTFTTVYWAYD